VEQPARQQPLLSSSQRVDGLNGKLCICAVRAGGCACNNGYTNEERCFLRAPCQDVISGKEFRAYSLDGEDVN
jgi:hypothetical protein